MNTNPHNSSLGSYELQRSFVQCSFTILLFTLSLFCGCTDKGATERALPAPIREEPEYEMVGRIRRMWGGDNMEFGQLNELHYLVIRGVTTPKPGQAQWGQSRSYAWRMVKGGRRVRVEVKSHDEMKREIADIYLINPDPADIRGELNLGLELLRGGYGWYNGEEFEMAEEYKQAEADAREQKIGIWATENPVAPWDFEATKQEQRRNKLDQQAATVSGGE